MKVDGGLVRPGLVAKSPSSEKTLLSSSGETGSATGSRRSLLLVVSNVQGVTGVVMMVLGVLCAVWGAALARLGAGVSGGLVALMAGLLGTLAALLPSSLYFTLYLALSLVSMAVNTLVLVLTLTAVVRDAQVDIEALPVEDGTEVWAGQWCGVGLLSATSLHLLVTLLSLPLSCRRACSRAGRPSPAEAHTKQTMVQTWLGQHNAVLLTPHLVVNRTPRGPRSNVSTPSKFQREVPYPVVPCSRSLTPLRHTRPPRRPTPDPAPQRTETIEKPKRKEKKKPREITEEELERTYTGLDREIAEEFIAIAMQPKANSLRSESPP